MQVDGQDNKDDEYLNSIIEVLTPMDIVAPRDLVGVPTFACNEKITSEGKRGFFSRCVKTAEKEFLVGSTSAASGSAEPSVAKELLNIFRKDPVKVISLIVLCCARWMADICR